MTAPVSIVDYDAGNMLSICRAFRHFDIEPALADHPDSVAQAERLVLPGVGAFGACMAGLRSAKLDQSVMAFIATGRPFLGICVGMQMLFDESHEFGVHAGLGVVPGKVLPIPSVADDGTLLKRPVIGWHGLEPAGQNWNTTLLEAQPTDTEVYFVHSFSAHPERAEDVLAIYDKHGTKITAAVRRGAVYGLQFHPEKSGAAGLKIIGAFLDL